MGEERPPLIVLILQLLSFEIYENEVLRRAELFKDALLYAFERLFLYGDKRFETQLLKPLPDSGSGRSLVFPLSAD